MKIYRKVMDFILKHLLLAMLTVVIYVLFVFFCIDRQSVMIDRLIIFLILWFALFIYTIVTEINDYIKR